MNIMKKTFLVTAVVLAMVAGLSNTAVAFSSYLTSFNNTYGTTATVLNTCNLCHPNGNTGSFTPYATAFASAGHNFGAIANLDSDVDGFTNIVEIAALKFPGDATSHPAVSDTSLFSDFGSLGLWQWNGSAWSQINTLSPASMVASGSMLYGNFTGYGLWQWNGRAWRLINTLIPESMVASGSILYANFTGYGLWQWNGSAWRLINTLIPASMVASGPILYANFTGYGLWKWDGSAWSQVNTVIPAKMATDF
jgi:hypothetical protein